MNNITLSELSVEYIIKLCKKIKTNCSNNMQSIEMADGIALYVRTHGRISHKQAEWVCRNADYWKMKRPSELASIVIKSKSAKQSSTSESECQSSDDILLQVLRRVKRAEKILEKRLPL